MNVTQKDIFRRLAGQAYHLCTRPHWGIQWIKHEFRKRGDRVYKKRIAEYENYVHSFDDGIIGAIPVDNSKIKELLNSPTLAELKQHVVESMSNLSKPPIPTSWSPDANLPEACYIACRAIKPQVIIETGVAYGVTTLYILKALEENRQGILHSIELPPPIFNYKKFVGFVVPPALRLKWRLYLGPSGRILPRVLDKCGDVDIFVHDSDHTYKGMLSEYEMVWSYLRPGGLLISDDVCSNDAFLNFAESKNCRPILLSWSEKQGNYVGILQK